MKVCIFTNVYFGHFYTLSFPDEDKFIIHKWVSMLGKTTNLISRMTISKIIHANVTSKNNWFEEDMFQFAPIYRLPNMYFRKY